MKLNRRENKSKKHQRKLAFCTCIIRLANTTSYVVSVWKKNYRCLRPIKPREILSVGTHSLRAQNHKTTNLTRVFWHVLLREIWNNEASCSGKQNKYVFFIFWTVNVLCFKLWRFLCLLLIHFNCHIKKNLKFCFKACQNNRT